jgi:hypothetical protein
MRRVGAKADASAQSVTPVSRAESVTAELERVAAERMA